MKGIELPINALIIIAVAVLVLLGIVALWMSGWGGGSKGVTIEAAKSAACSELMRYYGGCTAKEPYTVRINNFDADRDGRNDPNILPVPPVTDWCWAIDNPAGCAAVSACANTLPAATERDNLASLCSCYYNAWTSTDCRRICGCGG